MIIIVLIFICLFSLTIFVTPVNISNNTLLLMILSGISVFIKAILFSIRLFIYGLAEEKVKVWDEQIKSQDKQWQKWSMQSLAVLNSVVITPHNLSVDNLLKNKGNCVFLSMNCLILIELMTNSILNRMSGYFLISMILCIK